MQKSVLVIGSGIAGISASLKLKTYGVNSVIIDKGRFIGNHPISKEPIYVRVAKYGPVAQIGEYKKGTKLRYINIDNK